jgi:hypothetical protein
MDRVLGIVGKKILRWKRFPRATISHNSHGHIRLQTAVLSRAFLKKAITKYTMAATEGQATAPDRIAVSLIKTIRGLASLGQFEFAYTSEDDHEAICKSATNVLEKEGWKIRWASSVTKERCHDYTGLYTTTTYTFTFTFKPPA